MVARCGRISTCENWPTARQLAYRQVWGTIVTDDWEIRTNRNAVAVAGNLTRGMCRSPSLRC